MPKHVLRRICCSAVVVCGWWTLARGAEPPAELDRPARQRGQSRSPADPARRPAARRGGSGGLAQPATYQEAAPRAQTEEQEPDIEQDAAEQANETPSRRSDESETVIESDERVVAARPPLHDEAVAPASAVEPAEPLPLEVRDPGAVPLSKRSSPSIPLARPGSGEKPRQSGGWGAVGTAVGSLTVVLSLFLGVAWLMRRGLPRSAGALPRDVLEVLGRTSLGNRQQLQLLRLGNKLLLLCVTPHGAETLGEVTEPAEVDRLVSLVRRTQPGSVTDSFRQVLDQLGRDGGKDLPKPRAATPRGRGAKEGFDAEVA